MSHRISGYYSKLASNNPYIYPYAPVLYGADSHSTQHRIFPTDFALRDLLLDSYQIDNNGQDVKSFPLLPDGCISILFTLESQYSSAYIIGPASFTRKININPQASIFVMRLQPGCSDWLNIVPASELCGETFPLSPYLNNIKQLLINLRHAESFHERILFTVHNFNFNGAASYKRSPLLAHSVHCINAAHGNIKISDLSNKLGCCTRYLDMIFGRYLGLSTKNYCNIARMQYALRLITQQSTLLSEIALECGFFDQAHMNRNFKKFTGTTASFFRKPYNIIEGKLNFHTLNLTDMEA